MLPFQSRNGKACVQILEKTYNTRTQFLQESLTNAGYRYRSHIASYPIIFLTHISQQEMQLTAEDWYNFNPTAIMVLSPSPSQVRIIDKAPLLPNPTGQDVGTMHSSFLLTVYCSYNVGQILIMFYIICTTGLKEVGSCMWFASADKEPF